VTHAYTSQGVQYLAVMLHRLGLSFGAVSSALDALSVYMCKSRVYDAVQVAKRMESQWTRITVFEAIQRPVHGHRLLVKCLHHWLPLALTTDVRSRLVLVVTPLSAAEIATLREQIVPLVAALGGDVVVVNDPDA
jgi:hypothetical protein